MIHFPEYGGTGELPPRAYGYSETEMVSLIDVAYERKEMEEKKQIEIDAAWMEHERAERDA